MRKTYRLLASFILILVLAPYVRATEGNVKVLLVGSHGRGGSHWITLQSFFIENLLHFNGIPYDFFDIGVENLDPSVLDSYHGVILEGHAMRWDASDYERMLLAARMEAGSIRALVTLVSGAYTRLNSTIYRAMDVWVDGAQNSEGDINLLPGASILYDFPGDYGFLMAGGPGGKHVGVTVHSMSYWMQANWDYGGEPCYGVDLALGEWLERAFGADARVTLPIISLRFDDTQTTVSPRNQSVIDFIDANKHRIRASGHLVTNASAYQGSDSLLQHDEQIISRWGSMTLHGKDHTSAGAEGENQDYATQYAKTNQAVNFLEEHFPRYRAVKACPSNSWNQATLHAMYNNGIYYHSANMNNGEQYKALYKSLFDVDSDIEHDKMYSRLQSQFRYYPLVHTDETGEAKIYSADWYVCFDPTVPPDNVLAMMKRQTLDWWTPLMLGAHFYCPTGCGSNMDPQGWMNVMSKVMESADEAHCPWRRWVDNYDFAQNTRRFDCDFEVNSISVAGDVITYDLTADPPIRFVTLRAGKTGHKVEWVTIDGTDYAYFGDDYVPLPEIDGNEEVVVHLTSHEDEGPHLTYITPNAVIEDATRADDRLRLVVSGEFMFQASVASSSRVFFNSTTEVFPNRTQQVHADASSQNVIEQAGLSIVPSDGGIKAVVNAWDTAGSYHRNWVESYEPGPAGRAALPGCPDPHADVVVEDLGPNLRYLVNIGGLEVDTCYSNTAGQIFFSHQFPVATIDIDVRMDSSGTAAVETGGSSVEQGSGAAPTLIGHPNPFTRVTTISYHLARPSQVRLDIYSVDGWLVCPLVDRREPAGAHSVEWNGCDGRGNPVSPGLYFCRIRTGVGTETVKLALFR